MDARVHTSIETAHAELWKRFIPANNIILDYTALDGTIALPTADECTRMVPNGLGWTSPIANGAFFNGIYLPALCERYARTKNTIDRENAKRIASGLLSLAGASAIPGFIARGFSENGKGHYPTSSVDQVHPWFFGLAHYIKSGIPDENEKAAIVQKMSETVLAIEKNGWRIMSDGSFKGQMSGMFNDPDFRATACMLFVLRAMQEITREERWKNAYRTAVNEKPRKSDRTRREICAEGLLYDEKFIKDIRTQLWICAGAQESLRYLADREEDTALRDEYRTGLIKNAQEAARSLFSKKVIFNNADTTPLGLDNWRMLTNLWREQKTVSESYAVAQAQMRSFEKQCRGESGRTRRSIEHQDVREPLAAAYIVAVSGDRSIIDAAKADMAALLVHLQWNSLYFATFLFAECTYYAMPADSLQ